MVKGYQGDDLSANNTVMACVKHFALYGAAEAGRDYNTVDMSTQRMFEEYLPPYKAALDAGVGSVMSSFNEINGVPATANKWLLTDLLRKHWSFEGLTVSDANSVAELIAHGMAKDRYEAADLAFPASVPANHVSSIASAFSSSQFKVNGLPFIKTIIRGLPVFLRAFNKSNCLPGNPISLRLAASPLIPCASPTTATITSDAIAVFIASLIISSADRVSKSILVPLVFNLFRSSVSSVILAPFA